MDTSTLTGNEVDQDSEAEPVPARARYRLGLRTRLALLFPAATFLLTSLLATGTLLVLRTTQLDERESAAKQSAYATAKIFRDRLAASPGEPLGTLIDELPREARGNIGVQAGDWFSHSGRLAVEDIDPATFDLVTNDGQATIQRIQLADTATILVGIPMPSVGAAYFQSTSLEDLEQMLEGLTIALTGAVAITTMLAALLGRWFASAALAPLGSLTKAAEAVADQKLDTRLPETDDPDLSGITNSFNNMVAALQTRIGRDARFASDVSHELRSPLTTLAASVEVLVRRRDELPERSAAALDLLAADVSRFQHLVEVLLEISRFDSGSQQLELDEMFIAEFLAGASRQAAGRPVPVRHAPGLEHLLIKADQRRLVQVISNLVDNAAKYGGGVSLLTLETAQGGVEIGIEDNGAGVPEDQRQLIFERFARGSVANNRGSGDGTGLGLSLVAEHVALHGGRAWCEPARHSPTGARFAIFLPTPLEFEVDEDAMTVVDLDVGEPVGP